MYHCHPCFGGHKPVGPIGPVGPVCTTPPVIHPTKQCVTNTFSTTVVPHIHPTHTTHVHHQQVKNQHFFPQTFSNVNVVEPVAPGFGGGFGPGSQVSPFGPGSQVSPFGPGSQVSPFGPGPQVSPFGPGPNVGPQVSPFGPGPNVGPNVGGMFKK
ncbi:MULTISPECIES: CotD family spore coat protein [unclassified Bacillus (in: firmicutes)]|uniref:CotD family spore coat protein n=1 Tax=unclassified Bacillus (in: firmicutes) TaxID=185979 RepID=UPI00047B5149|nr:MULTISPECIES: CotD family spore coat protein [unclassified Bacillus (in: firmicutes)]SDZ04151.1 spore coat protein D [Bacillus sp. 166amftsu]